MTIINRCPFCGHTASVLHDTDEEGDDCYWVECDNCGAIGPTADNEDEAVENWNARRTDGFARWLDSEISKITESPLPWNTTTSIVLGRLNGVRRQFHKLMDGLGLDYEKATTDARKD